MAKGFIRPLLTAQALMVPLIETFLVWCFRNTNENHLPSAGAAGATETRHETKVRA